jgi:hypothetical protein
VSTQGVEIGAPVEGRGSEILTPDALAFVASLHRRFNAKRVELLSARAERQARIEAGEMPAFLPETRSVRDGDWKIAPVPADLHDRRVEITGPVDRKMMINALNSGARTFMADFEDANSPTWTNVVEGQANLSDAVGRSISLTTPEGKEYRLNDQVAVLIPRPRGWHLLEKHVEVDGASSTSGSRSSTTRSSCWTPAPGPTSTYRSSRATSRRASGTTSSTRARPTSVFPAAASRRPSSSRRSSPPSRWRRSSTSYATTQPA